MANTIDDAFIKQYESEAHLAYQQGASKFRNTVRTKYGVKGKDITFATIGKGAAASKTRNANVAVMNPVHAQKTATLADWYAGEYIDFYDELKTNVNERKAIVDTGAGAIGRKIDSLIVTSLETATQSEGAATALIADLSIFFDGIRQLNENDVPDDGQRYCAVSPYTWAQLLQIDAFVRAEYIGSSLPYLAGTEARKFMNVIFFLHTGLTQNDTGLVTQNSVNLMYHKSAVGLGEAKYMRTQAGYVVEKDAYFMHTSMSAGSVLIDPLGAVKLLSKDGWTA